MTWPAIQLSPALRGFLWRRTLSSWTDCLLHDTTIWMDDHAFPYSLWAFSCETSLVADYPIPMDYYHPTRSYLVCCTLCRQSAAVPLGSKGFPEPFENVAALSKERTTCISILSLFMRSRGEYPYRAAKAFVCEHLEGNLVTTFTSSK